MRLMPALALATSVLWLGAAQAGPAEDLAAVMDMTPGMSYETAVPTDDGGVLIQGVRANAGFVVESAGLAGAPGEPVADPSAITLVIDSLRLSEGAAAMLIGTSSGAQPGLVTIEIEGLRLDLAALAGPRPADLLREHLGADEIAGGMAFSLDPMNPSRQQAAIAIDLQPIGRVEIELAFTESGRLLPSGTVRLTDTPERGLIAFGSFVRRLSLEIALEWAEATVGEVEPGRSAEAEAALAEMRAQLAVMSLPAPEAAAALADWAEAMAAQLPEHADVLEAVAAFARGTGTLDLTIAPPDPEVDLASIAIGEPGSLSETAQIARAIETLGLGAEFRAE